MCFSNMLLNLSSLCTCVFICTVHTYVNTVYQFIIIILVLAVFIRGIFFTSSGSSKFLRFVDVHQQIVIVRYHGGGRRK
jgi:hypothetical protein